MTTASTITQYFENILMRSPSAAELSENEAKVAAGMTLEQVRDALVTSDESVTYAQQVIRIYQTAFGRIPDAAGLDGWVDAIREGTLTTSDLVGGFVASVEWDALYGGTEVTPQIIESLYQNILHRSATEADITAWQATGKDAGQILLAIANSAEAQLHCNDELVVLQQAAGNVSDASTVYTGIGALCGPDAVDPLNPDGPDTGTPAGGGGGGGSNNAPFARDDNYSFSDNDTQSVVVTEGLLANDEDLDGTFTLTSITDKDGAAIGSGSTATLDNGQVTVAADGSFTFLPAAGFQGEQEFTYTIQDSVGATDTASVTIDVNQAPDARSDFYILTGDTSLVIGEALGLLANDVDGTDTLLVEAGFVVTSGGGSVTIAADGSFTYDPGTGFIGNDTFAYTVTDEDGLTDTATATISVGTTVWFIDNTVGGGPGAGTQTDPFRSIEEFNDANGGIGGPAINDIVYLREGTYTEADGFTLLDGQTVIGQGQDLVIDGALVESGSEDQTPTINVTTEDNDAFWVAENNTIAGLDVGDTSGFGAGFYGEDVGNLSISDVAISGTGTAVDIYGGNLEITLDSIEIDGSGSDGIYLEEVDGVFRVQGTADINNVEYGAVFIVDSDALDVDFATVDIDGAGGDGIIVIGGIGDFDASAVQIDDVGFGGITVAHSAGGTFNFGTVDIGQVNIADDYFAAVDLSGYLAEVCGCGPGNVGATFDFVSLDIETELGAGLVIFDSTAMIGSLNIITSDGPGIIAYDATLNIQGTSNTIDATGYSAVDFDVVDLGTGATFASISSTDSADEGIDLNDVVGDLIINGGTVIGSDDEALDITGGTGAIFFGGTIVNDSDFAVDIYDRGADAGDVTIAGRITHTTGDTPGIYVGYVEGGVITFSGVGSSIDTSSAMTTEGIYLTDNTGATIDFTGGGLVIVTDEGTGFYAFDSGTVSVSGGGNAITTAGTTPIEILGTTVVGVDGIDFV